MAVKRMYRYQEGAQATVGDLRLLAGLPTRKILTLDLDVKNPEVKRREVVVVLQNPSQADAVHADYTVKHIIAFVLRKRTTPDGPLSDVRHVTIANLFTPYSTDPSRLGVLVHEHGLTAVSGNEDGSSSNDEIIRNRAQKVPQPADVALDGPPVHLEVVGKRLAVGISPLSD